MLFHYHIVAKLGSRAAKPLVHFSASFAHWRFETVARAFRKLLELQPLAPYFSASLYGRVQHTGLLAEVVEALGSPELWSQLVALNRTIALLEEARQWGDACSCHEDELRATP